MVKIYHLWFMSWEGQWHPIVAFFCALSRERQCGCLYDTDYGGGTLIGLTHHVDEGEIEVGYVFRVSWFHGFRWIDGRSFFPNFIIYLFMYLFISAFGGCRYYFQTYFDSYVSIWQYSDSTWPTD